MKINLESKLKFGVGDLVYIDIAKTNKQELECYNIVEAKKRKILGLQKHGIVVDMDTVFQPTMSKDFLGVKVRYGKEYWILPKKCFKKIKS